MNATSDDFNGGTVDPMWILEGIGASQSVGTSGNDAFLELVVPEGTYNAWHTNTAVRSTQAIDDVDFEIETHFLSTPTSDYQNQGLIVSQDDTNFLRFDVYHDGTSARLFGATTTNGKSVAKFNIAIADGAADYLRLNRTGSTWTFEYSADGVAWQTAQTLGHSLTVSSVGVFAAAQNNGYTAQVDYFFNTASPITPEDGVITSLPNNAPIAVDDAYQTDQDTVLTVSTDGILNNDTDGDSDPLSASLVSDVSNGVLSLNSDGSFTYTPNNGFTGTDSFVYRANDGTDDSSDTTVTITVGDTSEEPTPQEGSLVSDDFSGATLDNAWSLTGTGATANAEAFGDEKYLEIVVPNGTFNAWRTNSAVRTVQNIANEDFQLEARFLSIPTDDYQNHGILVEESETTFVRFDVYHSGSQLFLFAAKNDNTSPTVIFNEAISSAAEVQFLRLTRSGDTWTFQYSSNGTSWTTAGTTNFALNVTAAGPFAAAQNNGYTAQVDYFFNTASPVSPEDGIANQPTNNAPTGNNDTYNTDEDTQLTIAADGVLVNDSDVDGDALSAVLVSDVSNGTLSLNSDGSFSYTPNNGFTGTDSFVYRASDGTDQSGDVTVTINVETVVPATPLVSDDFSGDTLDPIWSLTGTGASAGLVTAGDEKYLEIVVPTGSFNAWRTNTAVRTVQTITNEDFELEARFLSEPTGDYQNHGILVEEDATNFIRFDVYHSGSQLFLFAAQNDNTTPSVIFNQAISSGDAQYLRVTRSGDSWTFQYSSDGVTWNTAGSTNFTLDVTAAGPFAAAQNNGYTAQVDYFFNTASPVSPEDGIAANNTAPVGNDDTYATSQDVELSVPANGVLFNDTDTNNDSLTAVLVSGVSNGTLSLSSDGSFIYTPNAGFTGTDSFVYRANDGTDQSGDVTVTLNVNTPNPNNSAPIANEDTFSATQDSELTVSSSGVAGNDTDTDGDTLTVSLMSDVSNGSLSLNSDGSFTYMPDAGFTGSDSFVYRAHDGEAYSNDVQVTINVTAPTPLTALVSDDFTDTSLDPVWNLVGEGASVNLETVGEESYLELIVPNGSFNAWRTNTSIRAVQNILDEDFELEARFLSNPTGDFQNQGILVEESDTTFVRFDVYHTGSQLFLFGATNENTSPSAVFNIAISPGSADYLRLTRSGDTWTFQYSSDGVSWNTAGTTNFALNVTAAGPFATAQNNGYTAQVDYFFNTAAPISPEDPQPTPPEANDDTLTTTLNAAFGISIASDLITNDTDIEGDALTLQSFEQPVFGSLVDNGDGTLTYTPAADFTGVDTFTYTITDGTFTDTATVSIGVDNSAPVAQQDSATTDEDNAVTIDILGNDIDPDGDAFSIISVTGAVNGEVTQNQDGTVTYTPDSDFFGSDSFSYIISDGISESTETVNVTVNSVEDNPVASDDALSTFPDTARTININLDLLANDDDADGDNLTFQNFTQPANGTLIDNGDGTLTYTPNVGYTGIDTFTYSITDGNTSDTATVNLSVADDTLINVWYGSVQQFGNVGETQQWVNILGNVDTSQVVGLSYSLNGGEERSLSIGADTRRLEDEGDFNVDIDFAELDGSTTDDIVTIRATLSNGDVLTRDVIIDFEAGNKFDKNYSIDWSTVTDIQDVAQVVDGEWYIDNGQLRTLQLGYDRIVAIGDNSWDNFEANFTITINEMGEGTPRDGAGFGLGLLWNGHTDDPIPGFQPLSGYNPIVSPFYSTKDELFTLHDHPDWNSPHLDQEPFSFTEGASYNVRVQIEQVNVLDRSYKFKIWETTEPEPTGWTLEGVDEMTEPLNGSLALIAHHWDISFGNIDVQEIVGDDIIQGNETDEIINAVNTADALPGIGEIDVLVGDGGSDTFVLGDGQSFFYDDNNSTTEGVLDYALIFDFVSGTDKIQLSGTADDYLISNAPADLHQGSAIYIANASGEDELIAIVNNISGLTLDNGDFIFV